MALGAAAAALLSDGHLGVALAAAVPAVAPEGTQPGGLASGAPPADVANKCSSCHAGGFDDDNKTFRPWDTWSGTMMAHATRDPLFLAALTISEQDVPGSGAFCLRCHTPKGFVKGNATGVGAALDADDNQGVDCEGCHRSINAAVPQSALIHDGAMIAGLPAFDPMAPYIGNARLFWDPRDVRHGPYDDADSPAHAAAGSAFGSSSELCGQCHEIQSPLRNLLDSAGRDTGLPFPLDNTYTEWRSSDFANGPVAVRRTCVDCHMPRARGDALTVSTFPTAQPRANPRMHVFVGGNEWGLDAVQMAAPELAIERAAAFAASKEAVRAMLAAAVTIDVTPGAARVGATTFEVQVRVTNLAGHKFPTGYADGRRAFLQVELSDGQDRVLAVLGKYDDSTQHLDPLTTPRIWESIQAERTSGGGHHEWHIAKNDIVVKDTRIPPQGFRPTGAAAITMTAPVGADFGPGPGGALRNYDDVQVRFSSLSPLTAGMLKVTARVFYQSTVREFIEELVRANVTDDRGNKLLAIWEQTGRAAPRLIHSRSSDVVVVAVGDGGSPNDGDGLRGDATPIGNNSGSGCQCGVAAAAPEGAAPVFLALLVVAGFRRRQGRGAP